MDTTTYAAVLAHINLLFPSLPLRSRLDSQAPLDAIPLRAKALMFDYVIVNQRRYSASRRATNVMNSLVEVTVDGTGRTWVGELKDIIRIDQKPQGVFTIGQFEWFRPFAVDMSQTLWAP